MLKEQKGAKEFFKYWWISMIVGILSIAAGVCCFIVPTESITAMTAFFIIILVCGGVFNIAWSVTNRTLNDEWGWSLARGIMEILLGIWLLLLPLPLVTTLLIYIIGFWMLFHAILGICESCALSEFHIKGWGWLLTCNILSLICSFLFLTAPAYGGVFVLVYIGISCILYGIFRITLSMKWRKLNQRLKETEEEVIDVEVIE